MTTLDTAALIDLVKRTMLGDAANIANEEDAAHLLEEAEIAATQIVGEIQARYFIAPLVSADEEAETQRLADALLPEVMRELFPAKWRPS